MKTKRRSRRPRFGHPELRDLAQKMRDRDSPHWVEWKARELELRGLIRQVEREPGVWELEPLSAAGQRALEENCLVAMDPAELEATLDSMGVVV